MLITASWPATADELTRYAGRCHSLTIFDRLVARQCQDKITVQTGATGQRGYLVTMDDGGVVFFIASDREVGLDGMRVMPVTRVDFGFRGEAESFLAIDGACRMQEPDGYRFEIECDVTTAKGRFTVKFTANDESGRQIAP